ncbi:antibiotic biosynthesis monooxygenase [Gordonia sp. LSe1-13]|uniref:Antibiotic biosynthesis monooxygenase n=1 Tax=Gordonia sesuvii TaxID=3116777 RepID=A0ABU7MAE3_9ACTN|nr:antibiotic biosynthesis monooxygenase [Gordonia sp. LSe1-13]
MKDGQVWEIVSLAIHEAELTEFEHGVRDALDVLRGSPGCFEAHYLAGIETPARPHFLIRWGSVAEHLEFRESERFAAYRSPIERCFEEAPSFAHFHVSAE